MESPRLIAGVARLVRDVGTAEELAQDALVAALEQWPRSGVPANPGAWLTTTARRRAVDLLRRRAALQGKQAVLAQEAATAADPAAAELDQVLDAVTGDDLGDDLLRLVFTACHPVLAPDARVALTLRLLGGLSTAEIARAYLTPETTVAQRIVRAKRALSAAHVPYALPPAAERGERLGSVLAVVYLIFNEGYVATSGDTWARPALCQEAMRLGRVLVGLVPAEPEVHGLVALMELQASRLRARVGADGAPVLLLDQDRGRWDHLLVRRGLAALSRAERLGGGHGDYALQAALAACHARARTAAETDWRRIVELYDQLMLRRPSPVVALNRAVAVSLALGPEAGLAAVDGLVADPVLAGYHLLPSVRADLLLRLGRPGEARRELARAASITRNERERDLLLARAAQAAESSRQTGR